jgi:PhnB protein
MQFLSLFTPAVPMPRPTPEHMERMNELTNRKFDTGELVATGALGKREAVGLRITKQGGNVTVVENPPGESVVMAAGGFAIMEAASTEQCIAQIKEFLEVAGDGTCECIGFAFPLMTPKRNVMGGVIASFMVDGAAAASLFYQKAFGARELGRYAHTDGKRLMHCHLEINGGSMMFNDPMPEHGYPLQASSSYTMNLVVNDGDSWWNRALEAGCKVTMPLERAFWGDRYGRLVDPFGIAWAIDEPASQAAAAA